MKSSKSNIPILDEKKQKKALFPFSAVISN